LKKNNKNYNIDIGFVFINDRSRRLK